MSRSIILCADDFAQTEAASQGILQLLDARRLTAVSCMTEPARWTQDAVALRPYSDRADIGLHFNLTHSFGQQIWPLSSLMTAAWHRSIPSREIETRLQHQLDRFETAMDCPPDFVDGHQHIHAFPWIRDIVHRVLATRYPQQPPYLRSVALRTLKCDAPLKTVVLKLLTHAADRAAEKAGFRRTAGFAGVYSLTPEADFGRHMQTWLETATDGMLVMCHPGLPGGPADDPSALARPKELAYLMSDAFRDALAKTGVHLTRFRLREATGIAGL